MLPVPGAKPNIPSNSTTSAFLSHFSLQLRSISLTPAFNTNKNGISARFSGFLFPSSRDMFAPKIEHTFVFLCCSTPFFECKNLFCRKYETYHVTAEGIRTPHTSHLPLISTISKNPSHFSLQLDRKTPAFSLCCFVTSHFFLQFHPIFLYNLCLQTPYFPRFVSFSTIRPDSLYN